MNSDFELDGGNHWDPDVLIQKPQYDQSVLIIGCQKGTVANKLAQKHPDWAIHGVDFNQDFISDAVKNSETNAIFECIDIRYDEPITCYDWIMLQGFLSWVDKPTFDAALRWANFGTLKGGYVKISYDNLWTNFDLLRFRKLMRFLLNEGHKRNDAIKMIQIKHPELNEYCLMYDEFLQQNYIHQEHYNTFCPDEMASMMIKNGFEFVRDASPRSYSIIDDKNPTKYEIWRKK